MSGCKSRGDEGWIACASPGPGRAVALATPNETLSPDPQAPSTGTPPAANTVSNSAPVGRARTLFTGTSSGVTTLATSMTEPRFPRTAYPGSGDREAGVTRLAWLDVSGNCRKISLTRSRRRCAPRGVSVVRRATVIGSLAWAGQRAGVVRIVLGGRLGHALIRPGEDVQGPARAGRPSGRQQRPAGPRPPTGCRSVRSATPPARCWPPGR